MNKWDDIYYLEGTKFFSYLIHEGLSHLCNLRSESSDLYREKHKKAKPFKNTFPKKQTRRKQTGK